MEFKKIIEVIATTVVGATVLFLILLPIVYVLFYLEFWKINSLFNNPVFLFLFSIPIWAIIKFIDNKTHFMKVLGDKFPSFEEYTKEDKIRGKTKQKLLVVLFSILIIYAIGLFELYFLNILTKMSYWYSPESFIGWTVICFIALIAANFLIKREKE